MERKEILKSVGFSNEFINALQEFEKSVPNIYYEVPFDEGMHEFKVIDASDELIIKNSNSNYSENIVVKSH